MGGRAGLGYWRNGFARLIRVVGIKGFRGIWGRLWWGIGWERFWNQRLRLRGLVLVHFFRLSVKSHVRGHVAGNAVE